MAGLILSVYVGNRGIEVENTLDTSWPLLLHVQIIVKCVVPICLSRKVTAMVL